MKQHFCPVEKSMISFQDKCNWCGEVESQDRTWVGLTDVEIDYLLGSTIGENEETHISFARAIEAKLKQKNGFAEEKNT